MNNVYIVLAFLFFATSSKGQQCVGSLKVIIENAEDDGIVVAQMAVYRGEKLVTGGAPDRFGLVDIPTIAPGLYQIEISCIGFESAKRTIHIEPELTTTIGLSLIQEPNAPNDFPMVDSTDGPSLPIRIDLIEDVSKGELPVRSGTRFLLKRALVLVAPNEGEVVSSSTCQRMPIDPFMEGSYIFLEFGSSPSRLTGVPSFVEHHSSLEYMDLLVTSGDIVFLPLKIQESIRNW